MPRESKACARAFLARNISPAILLAWVSAFAVALCPNRAHAGWTAYNDCVYASSLDGVATDPTGQSVHYIAANVTTFGIGSGFSGSSTGELLIRASGVGTGVTATLTESGGVIWQSDVSSSWTGGYDTAVGTDARDTFNGIADMTGVIYYGSVGWYVDLTVTGLDPNETYTFATTASRAKKHTDGAGTGYDDRDTIYTISSADAATNASTPGVTEINPLSVYFCTGNNHDEGYVARWTGISPGADGSFTVRAEAHPNCPDGGRKAYSFDVFMLRQDRLDTCEDFETGYTPGTTVGSHADWFDGGSGPVVTGGVGVAGSVGLAPGSRIFTWTAHPFEWSEPNLAGVILQMDFETDGSAEFNDDRMGWMITDSSTSSDYIFGVQLDNASGHLRIEGYWDHIIGVDEDKRPEIVDLDGVTLDSDAWYRFRAEITKLTDTSARIDVELWSLDASGNLKALVAKGTLADTSVLGGDSPDPAYFAGTMWPAFKNFDSASGECDNACYQICGSLGSPPDQPTLVSPPDGNPIESLGTELRVNVTDPDFDDLDVTFWGRQRNTEAGEDFTIIALPDTQKYSRYWPDVFVDQTEWIVANKDAWNIVYVAHEGDLVDRSDEIYEWDNANAALSLLEDPNTTGLTDGIPYGVVPGNHDQPTGNYNDYFGVSRFDGRGYYGGHYAPNSNDDNFTLFSAGGMDFIVIHLNYDTSPDLNILNWANDLLQTTYSSRRAIVVSHYIMEIGEQADFGTQGQAIYDALKGNANLFLMLCGHRHGEGKRVDEYGGNTLNTLLADYQDEQPYDGNGWLRILAFSPVDNKIRVKTYSPTLLQYRTGSSSQFELDYDMGGSAFVALGTVSGVTNGSDASLDWTDLSADKTYDWYVEVSDGSRTTTGPVWSFTTPPVVGLTLEIVNDTWGDVVLDPEPSDPNLLEYPIDTEVTLTAVPIEGKAFRQWTIYDPCYPGDANYAVIDANTSTTLAMHTHRQVTAAFKCGSGMPSLLPVTLVALGLFAWVRRRT